MWQFSTFLREEDNESPQKNFNAIYSLVSFLWSDFQRCRSRNLEGIIVCLFFLHIHNKLLTHTNISAVDHDSVATLYRLTFLKILLLLYIFLKKMWDQYYHCKKRKKGEEILRFYDLPLQTSSEIKTPSWLSHVLSDSCAAADNKTPHCCYWRMWPDLTGLKMSLYYDPQFSKSIKNRRLYEETTEPLTMFTFQTLYR